MLILYSSTYTITTINIYITHLYKYFPNSSNINKIRTIIYLYLNILTVYIIMLFD